MTINRYFNVAAGGKDFGQTMHIKFWGVRGSIPAPVGTGTITAKIIQAVQRSKGVDLDDPEAVRAYVESLPLEIRGTSGGNTPCVQVLAGGNQIILDAGSGIRELGEDLMKGPFGQGQGVAHIFMSHTHWDHIQGFPFFLPAYIKGNRFFIYSPKKSIEEKFTRQQVDQDMFPVRLGDMSARIEFITMGPEGVDLDGVKVRSLMLPHPGGSHAFRFDSGGKTLIYATDGEYRDLSDESLRYFLNFFQDADALIFDSMYTFGESKDKEGWGHSTSLMGVDLAVQTGSRNLILFHHEPTYSDEKLMEILEKTTSYFSLVRQDKDLNVLLATEGLELEL